VNEKDSFVDFPLTEKTEGQMKITKIEHDEGSKAFHADVHDHDCKKNWCRMKKIESTKSEQLNPLLQFFSNSFGSILVIYHGSVNTIKVNHQ